MAVGPVVVSIWAKLPLSFMPNSRLLSAWTATTTPSFWISFTAVVTVDSTGPPVSVRTQASTVKSSAAKSGDGVISAHWPRPSRTTAWPVTTGTGGSSRMNVQTWLRVAGVLRMKTVTGVPGAISLL